MTAERSNISGEGREAADDLATDVLNAVCENVDDWPPPTWPFWVKRYAENDVEILMRLRFPREGACGPFRDWIANLKCALPDYTPPIRHGKIDGVGIAWPQLRLDSTLDNEAGNDWQAVLVFGRQLVERPERVKLRILPSVEGLHVLDDCLRSRLHASGLLVARSPARTPTKILSAQKDREFRSFFIGGRIAPKLPREVIEGRANVMQEIANKKTEMRGWAEMHARAQAAFSRFVILLQERSVGFVRIGGVEEAFDLIPERFEVLVCACQPQGNRIERVSHWKNLAARRWDCQST
jgi:hypothetical protein